MKWTGVVCSDKALLQAMAFERKRNTYPKIGHSPQESSIPLVLDLVHLAEKLLCCGWPCAHETVRTQWRSVGLIALLRAWARICLH